MEIADPTRILFGSDFPFSRHRSPVQDLKSTIAGFEAFDGWDDTDPPGHRARQRAGAVSQAGEGDGGEGLIFLALSGRSPAAFEPGPRL